MNNQNRKNCPDSCPCKNCDVGHCDLELRIVKCPLTGKPVCPGADDDKCKGYEKMPCVMEKV